MNRDERLRQLETLLGEPSLTKGFPSQDTCLNWATAVAPLLAFDPNYHATFLLHLQRLCMPLSGDALGASLRIMIAQARMAANSLRAVPDREPLPADLPQAGEPKSSYVDPERMAQLRLITTSRFELSKLLQLIEELDLSFRSGCYLATAMLVRAVLDHVPPIFGVRTFAEVANNYSSGSKSFRQSMLTLDTSSRAIADQHLHCQIRARESLPTARQVDFSQDLDVLLGEVVRLLGSKP